MIKRLFLVLALLVAPAAFAADGDRCDSGASVLQAKGAAQGQYNISCYYLCFEKVDTASACTEFDMNVTGGPGIPDKVLIELSSVADCDDAYSIDINHGSISGGAEHDLATLTSSTTAASIGSEVALGRFLNTDIDNDTNDNCTNMTVILWAYRRIR